MADSRTKLPINKSIVYVYICISLVVIFIVGAKAPGYIAIIRIFFVSLFILWFNKYISGKIKPLFGFDIQGGNLIVTRTIENPGIYNVFSDMVTGAGNFFIYIVTLEFLYDKSNNDSDNN